MYIFPPGSRQPLLHYNFFFFYTNFGQITAPTQFPKALFSSEMNCTTYRTELWNIVFKSINTHPSSMSRQKNKNKEDSGRRYEET